MGDRFRPVGFRFRVDAAAFSVCLVSISDHDILPDVVSGLIQRDNLQGGRQGHVNGIDRYIHGRDKKHAV